MAWPTTNETTEGLEKAIEAELARLGHGELRARAESDLLTDRVKVRVPKPKEPRRHSEDTDLVEVKGIDEDRLRTDRHYFEFLVATVAEEAVEALGVRQGEVPDVP